MGCELARGAGKVAWARGGTRGVFPLAWWSSNADTAHPHPTTASSPCSVHQVPSFCLYLLWRRLKTHPWLPAGPEAEVTSLALERLWGWKSTASPPVHLPQNIKGLLRAFPGHGKVPCQNWGKSQNYGILYCKSCNRRLLRA